MEFLDIRDATVWRGDNAALRGLSLVLREGESVAVLGPNGAGKSTFLKLLTGELRPEAGRGSVCRLFGEDLWSLEELRHRIGVVMPEEVSRFEDWEIAGNVVLSSLRGAYGRTRHMRFSQSEKVRAFRAMELMGVAMLHQRPFGTLSSGEKRRFLIARSVVHEPGVLVLDEPSTALDFSSSLQLSVTLRDLLKHGRTLVWVTHHPGEIPPEIDRVILLKNGGVFADGTKRETLSRDVLSRLYEVDLKVRWSGGWCDVRFE
jgi:iron complex transport system ATP-binding protein